MKARLLSGGLVVSSYCASYKASTLALDRHGRGSSSRDDRRICGRASHYVGYQAGLSRLGYWFRCRIRRLAFLSGLLEVVPSASGGAHTHGTLALGCSAARRCYPSNRGVPGGSVS